MSPSRPPSQPRPLPTDDPRELRRRMLLAIVLGPPRAVEPAYGPRVLAPPRPNGARR